MPDFIIAPPSKLLDKLEAIHNLTIMQHGDAYRLIHELVHEVIELVKEKK